MSCLYAPFVEFEQCNLWYVTQVRSGEAPVEIFIPVFNLYTPIFEQDNNVINIPCYVNGGQDLHENLLCIGDTAFLGYQIESK